VSYLPAGIQNTSITYWMMMKLMIMSQFTSMSSMMELLDKFSINKIGELLVNKFDTIYRLMNLMDIDMLSRYITSPEISHKIYINSIELELFEMKEDSKQKV